MTHMRGLFLGLAYGALAIASPATASKKGWKDFSDVGVYSLTALSLGLPAIEKDGKGALHAAGSMGAAFLVTEGLKEAFPKTRPDGSDRRSFPSGHTSRSFAAAATLYKRQGAAVGIPAFAVAGIVGVARVKADKHFWSDVIVGAGVGTATGLLITNSKPEAQSALIPWGDSKGAGFTYALRF